MPKGTRWLGYVLFVVLLIGISLYVCFPSEPLRDYLEGSAARFAPSLVVRIHAVEPSLPFGLSLADAYLGLRKRQGVPVFEADSLRVAPSLRTVTLMKPAFSFDCEAYGGRIEGLVALKEWSWAGPVRSDIEITGLHLEEYAGLQAWLQGDLTGAMSGTAVYVGTPGDLLRGSGEVKLSILDGTYRFPQPFLGMEAVDFNRVDTQMVLEEEKISVVRFDFKAKEMQGTASGIIDLRPDIAQSRLDLKVSLKAFSPFLAKKGVFTMSVRGTLARPQISFI